MDDPSLTKIFVQEFFKFLGEVSFEFLFFVLMTICVIMVCYPKWIEMRIALAEFRKREKEEKTEEK